MVAVVLAPAVGVMVVVMIGVVVAVVVWGSVVRQKRPGAYRAKGIC